MSDSAQCPIVLNVHSAQCPQCSMSTVLNVQVLNVKMLNVQRLNVPEPFKDGGMLTFFRFFWHLWLKLGQKKHLWF